MKEKRLRNGTIVRGDEQVVALVEASFERTILVFELAGELHFQYLTDPATLLRLLRGFVKLATRVASLIEHLGEEDARHIANALDQLTTDEGNLRATVRGDHLLDAIRDCAQAAGAVGRPVARTASLLRRFWGNFYQEEELQAQFNSLILKVADPHFDISATSWACDSSQSHLKDALTVLSDSIDWAELYFDIPEWIGSIRPFVSQRNYRPNAFALADFHTAVGFNLGLSYAIVDACSSVAHHEDFLPTLLEPLDNKFHRCFCVQCGGPRELDTVFSDYSWLTGASESSLKHWVPLKASTTPTPRSIVGNQLCAMCLSWAANHEIGHVVLGHLEWNQQQVLMEAFGASTPASNDDEPSALFCAEIEADQLATRNALSNRTGWVRDLARRFKNGRASSTWPGKWPSDLGSICDRLIFSTPLILQGILARASDLRYSEFLPNYPSASFRRHRMVDVLMADPVIGLRLQALPPDKLSRECTGAIVRVFENWNGPFDEPTEDEWRHYWMSVTRAISVHGTLERRIDLRDMSDPAAGLDLDSWTCRPRRWNRSVFPDE